MQPHMLSELPVRKCSAKTIKTLLFASVVPPLDLPVSEAIRNFLDVEALRVDAFTDIGMEIRYASPREAQ